MPRLTQEEIAARRKELVKEATTTWAKTESLNLRIDEETLLKVHALAAKANKPVGALVRDWIVERVSLESQGPNKVMDASAEIQGALAALAVGIKGIDAKLSDIISLPVSRLNKQGTKSKDQKQRKVKPAKPARVRSGKPGSRRIN